MNPGFCTDERRRQAVRHHHLNGIDHLEVVDREAASPLDRQRLLHVYFVRPPAPDQIVRAANVRISGGTRVTGLRVVAAPFFEGEGSERRLVVRVSEPGDFSRYRLSLVETDGRPLVGLDGPLSSIEFSFKIGCDAELDCHASRPSPRLLPVTTGIDYQAKDFESFRRLMLERLARTQPNVAEAPAADLGLTLVELLAYVADHLSYQQDAVATEAYLATCRHRLSARRHARLVDYRMHDGVNARVWVQLDVDADLRLEAGALRALRLVTRVDGVPGRVASADAAALLARAPEAEWFEPLPAPGQPALQLSPRLRELTFHTWGARVAELARGACSATLRGHLADVLAPGGVLVLEEVRGRCTGLRNDAAPERRHAVRLTQVRDAWDPLGGRFEDPPTDAPAAITEVVWHDDDALPFELCLATLDDEARTIADVSVARGNVILCDHGRTLSGVPLGTPATTRGFRPRLPVVPVTQAAPYAQAASAAAATSASPERALPQLEVADARGRRWLPQRDLLASDAFRRELVVEVDDDAGTWLRFGDGEYGAPPASGVALTARYRVGNGVRGNVAADAIAHVVGDLDGVVGARNPLPARGGVDAEELAAVQRTAPHAFHRQERAVTSADYAEVAERHPAVQRAVATVRWTGTWRTVFLSVDRLGRRPVDATFRRDLRAHLERYRLAAQDVEIEGPRFVPLTLELSVCVAPGQLRSHVRAAVLELLSSGVRADGQLGYFHPDRLSFGQPVALAPIIALVSAVEGVRHVEVLRFHRHGVADPGPLAMGELGLGRMEIARLDNDPDAPEQGALWLRLEGGR